MIRGEFTKRRYQEHPPWQNCFRRWPSTRAARMPQKSPLPRLTNLLSSGGGGWEPWALRSAHPRALFLTGVPEVLGLTLEDSLKA